jgi:hypothetical protein
LADWTRPEYPAGLTKATWDKKKSILAKIGGATGIGEELTKLKRLYDAVDWDKIEIAKHLPKGNEFTKKDWAQRRNDALKEVAGSLTKFYQELYRQCPPVHHSGLPTWRRCQHRCPTVPGNDPLGQQDALFR